MLGSRHARVLSLVLAAMIGVGAVACDEPRTGGGGGSPTPTPNPTPNPTPSTPPTPTTGTLLVDNESGYTVWYLNISPSSTSDWGPDQLGSNVLSPGHVAQFTNVPCNQGTYDLRAQDSAHDELATHYGMTIECGRTVTWTLY